MSNWHPIETAPRDGTYILTYDSSIDKVVPSFYGTIYMGDSDFAPIEMGFLSLESKLVIQNPTHWMPLPKSPKEEKYSSNS